MIPNFPIPDSGIPNSEIRMAYGKSRIPHHEVAGPRGAHEGHMRSAGTGKGGGSDIGCPMPIAGGGHSMSGGGQNGDQGNLIHKGSGPL